MKKIPFVLIISAFCFVLSGCMDVFQHFTVDAAGTYHNAVKITVSKSIFELAQAFGETEETADYDSLFEGSLDEGEYAEFGAAVTKINDASDVGLLIEMTLDYKDRATVDRLKNGDIDFIPQYDQKNLVIHIGQSNAALDGENEMVGAFLGAAKYRLVVSKKCIIINRAALKVNGKEIFVSFLDLQDEYLIEVPLMTFLNASDLVLYSK
jgi:hypothetical protein